LDGRFPERVLEKAVERMSPRGPLGRLQLSNLRGYKGSCHPHAAQKPMLLDVDALNPKNKRTTGRRDMGKRPSNDFIEALMGRLSEELTASNSKIESALDDIKKRLDKHDQTMGALATSLSDYNKRAVAEYDSNQVYQKKTDEDLRSIMENTRRTADILEKILGANKNTLG
jgi:hypothetical protein